jgi:hypothetical protein
MKIVDDSEPKGEMRGKKAPAEYECLAGASS